MIDPVQQGNITNSDDITEEFLAILSHILVLSLIAFFVVIGFIVLIGVAIFSSSSSSSTKPTSKDRRNLEEGMRLVQSDMSGIPFSSSPPILFGNKYKHPPLKKRTNSNRRGIVIIEDSNNHL